MSLTNLKTRLTIVAVVAAVLAGASFQAAQAEPTGSWMIATYKVYDYNRWKPVYDRTAAAKKNYGWKKSAVFAVDGNRNHIMVMEQFGALDRARAFADSIELRDEMAASGVSSQPEIRFVNTLGGETP